jgi:hypothetical protein
MFGLPQGFAPLARFYRMPLLVLVGEITDKPVAIGGKVKVRPMLPLTATIDHRYADGWHISQLLKPFKAYFADPAAFEPDPATVAAPQRPAPDPTTPPQDGAGDRGARPASSPARAAEQK